MSEAQHASNHNENTANCRWYEPGNATLCNVKQDQIRVSILGHVCPQLCRLSETLTKKSTTYGAVIDPTCDMVELVPSAEFRISVGNISAVCSVTIE